MFLKYPVAVNGVKIFCGARMINVSGYIYTLSKKICYLTEIKPRQCRMERIVVKEHPFPSNNILE
ncbi:MAG TPA: hypothetical protein DCP53_08695 [Elusimicrobia bacterium]|nr:hypothetical protein [Elusimicrobiota bacterium]